MPTPTRTLTRSRKCPATCRPATMRNVEDPGRLPLPPASVLGSVSPSESETKRNMRFDPELELDPDPHPDPDPGKGDEDVAAPFHPGASSRCVRL